MYKPSRKSIALTLASLFLLFVICPHPTYAEGDDADNTSAANEQSADKIEPVKTVKGRVERQLTLSLGVSRTLEFNFDIGPIYQTDPSLFDYKRVNDNGKERKLLIIPKNSGYTDMTIHDAQGVPRITYYVRVTREDLGQVISQLEDLLGDIEGLKIRSLGGTIILDGEILLPRDMIRIMRVIDAMKDRDPKKKEVPIRNLATISKLTMNILAERIEREVGSPEITARVVNNNIFLEGTAESDFEADRAVEIAKTYLPEVYVEKTKGEGGEVKPKQAGGIGGGLPTIVDLLRVRPRQAAPPSQDIKITMNYVELDNDYSNSFNFSWQPLATDQSTVKFDTAAGLTASLVATVTSLLPKLITARDHGHARILKQQQVIVKDHSSAPAIIDSSLQLYTRVVDEKGGVAFQPIEIRNSTKVSANTIPGSDSLDLGIQLELAQPAATNGTGPPSITKNVLQTQVTIKNGESAALGGNAIDQALAAYNKQPTAASDQSQQGNSGGAQSASTTALFNFNRSKAFQHDKSQFIIFITPEVIRTASGATEDMTRKFRLNAGER